MSFYHHARRVCAPAADLPAGGRLGPAWAPFGIQNGVKNIGPKKIIKSDPFEPNLIPKWSLKGTSMAQKRCHFQGSGSKAAHVQKHQYSLVYTLAMSSLSKRHLFFVSIGHQRYSEIGHRRVALKWYPNGVQKCLKMSSQMGPLFEPRGAERAPKYSK